MNQRALIRYATPVSGTIAARHYVECGALENLSAEQVRRAVASLVITGWLIRTGWAEYRRAT